MTVSFKKLKELFARRSVKLILVLLLGLLLLLAAFRVFSPKRGQSTYTASDREAKLSALLEKLDGVKSAAVMITEQGGDPASAVVIYEGEDTFLLRIRLAEVAAGALGIEEREIRVYAA